MVHRNFDELLKLQDKREEAFQQREKEADDNRSSLYAEVSRKLEHVHSDNVRTIERVEQHEKMIRAQLATNKHVILEGIDERLKYIEEVQENIDQELETKIKKHFAVNL